VKAGKAEQEPQRQKNAGRKPRPQRGIEDVLCQTAGSQQAAS